MMRRGPAPKRHIEPDPVYRSLLVSQIINKVLLDGKKETARSIVYGALEIVERRVGQDPLTVLKRAVDNIRPQVEVRSRRVGGSSYQVPVEVRPRRANSRAIRWMVTFARKRKENAMAERLANEILDASNNTGAAVKRREDIHKMAESNKAFAHYRW
ncbi:MAG: 30S ribosomal protein S7 [Acidimicrobiia bacterium]|nr:30S ribosomal protein S7 [Acidimicrobiia bacterium]